MRPPAVRFVVESPAHAPGGRAWDLEALAGAIGLPVRVELPAGQGAEGLDPVPAAILLLPPGSSPSPAAVRQGLELLCGPGQPGAVADLPANDSARLPLLRLYLDPERVGAVLLRAEVADAAGLLLPGSGTLARASALARVACGFEIVPTPAPLAAPVPNATASAQELNAFGVDALARFAIEDLYPLLRTPEGDARHAQVLLECASRLLGAGRLTEGFFLGAQAQALLEGRETGMGPEIAATRPPPPRSSCEPSGPLRELPADPLVSVIIPTLNRPALLARALESVARQTWADLEVVVVNDAGEDPSPALAPFRERIGGGGRLTVVHHDRNRGLPAARNTGLRLARGRYVCFLDDDDRLLPHHLEALVPTLRLGARVVHGDVRSVVETPATPLPVASSALVRYQVDYEWEHYGVDNCFPVQSVVCERELLLEAGGFDESLPVLEDWDLWLRVFEIVRPLHVRRVTSEVRQRDDESNMTWSSNDVWLHLFAHIYEKTLRFEQLEPQLRRDRVRNLVALAERRGTAFPRDSARWLRGEGALAPIDPDDPLAAWPDPVEGGSANDRQPPPRPAPCCSIVIPVLNRLDLTQQCLDELFKVTDGILYEVIVVDNGSDDGTAEYLASLGEKIRVISNPENLGFAVACNQGARVARGDHVVFLNNDTIPLRGWLRAMVGIVDAEPDVGVVGSKLLFPDHSVQHAGIAMSREYGTPYHIYRGAPEDAPSVNRRRDLNGVTAACMLVRRSAFEQVGGFDEGYRNSFEDIDLCFRLVQHGHRVVYEPSSVLFHLESQTPGRKDHDGYNILRFRERWGEPWWVDEERVYAEDGCVVVRTDPPEIRPFHDQGELARWMRVAEVQFRAPREGVGSVRALLEPSEWPRERIILAWGESLCTAGGLPDRAARFRAALDALPEDSGRPAGA